MRKLYILAALFFAAFVVEAQRSVQTLIVPRGILIPGDSLAQAKLIGSLRGWLELRDKPDSANAYLSKERPVLTSVLMDELRSIDWYVKKDSASACKCYLGNVVSLDSSRCMVQLNYMGIRKDTPVLRACCTVLAHLDNDKWIFSSPLMEETAGWKSRTIGNCTFHYKRELNVKKARVFMETFAGYDRRLNAGATTIDFYCCDSRLEAGTLIGEDYRLDYNGLKLLEFSSDYGAATVIVSGEPFIDGFNTWDAHDWWHGRLHRVVPPSTIYRPVDEGMAYLYGGSWRVYTWEDILARFKGYAADHPGSDWLALYKSGTDYVAMPANLKISYVINALIVRRIGFTAAMPLLTCGAKHANYFAALKEVVGVDEAGFNVYVKDLIKDNEKL